MNRVEFDELTITQQMNELNMQMSEGKSFNSFCDGIGIPRGTMRNRIRKNSYKYNKELNQYIKCMDSNSNEVLEQLEVATVVTDIEVKEIDSKEHISSIEELQEQLKLITNRLLLLEKEMATVKSKEFKIDTEVELIDYSLLADVAENRNLKIYKSVLIELQEVQEKFNGAFRLQDIVSTAIHIHCKKFL